MAKVFNWVKEHRALSALFVVLLCMPLIFMNYSYGLMICCFIEIYVIGSSGYDILQGYAGQVSMGHAAFYAIGAYGTFLMNSHLNIPPFTGILISCLLSAGLGALLAYPASNLKSSFLALATQAFNQIIYQILIHSPGGITGDHLGIFGTKLRILGIPFDNYTAFYYFGLVCVFLFIAAKIGMVHSRFGRAIQAIKQNPHAAEGMGVDTRKYKIIAFAVSAFYFAFAGGMYATLVGYISPDSFTIAKSLQLLTMLMLGGTCSIAGPILGSIVITLLNELLRGYQEYQMLVYGIVLLLVILVMPAGLLGTYNNLKASWAAKRAAKKGETQNA